MDASPSAYGRLLNAAIILLALLCGSCAESRRAAAQTPPDAAPPLAHWPTVAAQPSAKSAGYDQVGIASWYGPHHQGRRTASGTRFDPRALTAAHGSLPLGTLVLVENLANGRRVALRITDRGPYVQGRIVDLSQAAAQHLGLEQQGLGLVGLTVLAQALPLHLASACPDRRGC
jgi:rare lipoprotein A